MYHDYGFCLAMRLFSYIIPPEKLSHYFSFAIIRITPRKIDEVHSNVLGYGALLPSSGDSLASLPRPHNTSTVIARGRRVSLTFRKVKHSPCSCSELLL